MKQMYGGYREDISRMVQPQVQISTLSGQQNA